MNNFNFTSTITRSDMKNNNHTQKPKQNERSTQTYILYDYCGPCKICRGESRECTCDPGYDEDEGYDDDEDYKQLCFCGSQKYQSFCDCKSKKGSVSKSKKRSVSKSKKDQSQTKK